MQLCETVAVSVHEPEPMVPAPLCPECRRPLRDTLRVTTVEAVAEGPTAGSPVAVAFCGACATTLSAVPPPPPPAPLRVPDPVSPDSVEGRFQLRCRELIEEIQDVRFTPGGWIGLITSDSAVGAARKLLLSGRILPVTRWLIDRGRPELTMEHEVTRRQWQGIFTDVERAEAQRRLVQAAGA